MFSDLLGSKLTLKREICNVIWRFLFRCWVLGLGVNYGVGVGCWVCSVGGSVGGKMNMICIGFVTDLLGVGNVA